MMRNPDNAILYSYFHSKYESKRNLPSVIRCTFSRFFHDETGSRKPALDAQLDSRLGTCGTHVLSFYNTLTFKLSLFKCFKPNPFL